MKGPWLAAALMLLAGCDWAEQAQGTHLPAIKTEAKDASIGLVPRTEGPLGAADSGLQCPEPKEIGAAYPMILWIRLGQAPGIEPVRTPRGGWTVGDRYVPDQLSIRIDRQRFETLQRRLTVDENGDLILSGNAPQEETLFRAIARARMLTLLADGQERSLAVAVWRPELIKVSEICEQNTLAWQFLQ
jgi:hypothetical protein